MRNEIEQHITHLNEQVLRPLDRLHSFVGKSTYSTPMAILLGNHSSGKSTFINKLLGQPEQHTGVAPTDDGFTVVMRGEVNMDEDGPSAVSNPQLGFGELKPFGPGFVNHFKVKTRSLPASSRLPHGMMIIDTPGMIDTPVHVTSRTTVEGQNRGYDFIGVTKWFAQRADVILLLFDPANPGTTGETLDVLTHALQGHEHKFLILFNKVDTFDTVVDFARTYGTLTWNLSKVIPMKDIPKVYTTFTELGPETGALPPTNGGTAPVQGATSAVPLAELRRSVNDVIEEVLKAPLNRLDNLVTESEEAALKVAMSMKVQNGILRASTRSKLTTYAMLAAGAVAVPGAMLTVLVPLEAMSMMITSAVLLGGAAFGLNNIVKRQQHDQLKLVDDIDAIFESVFPPTEQTAEVIYRWKLVKKPLVHLMKSQGVDAVQGGTSRDIRRLESVIYDEIPKLRLRVKEYKMKVLRVGEPHVSKKE